MTARHAFAAAALLACATSLAAEAAPPQRLPFSAEEDADGSRSVWFILRGAGFPYEYVPAGALRASPHFEADPKNAPSAGAVAWWPSRVGIVLLGGMVRSFGFEAKLSELEAKLGPATILGYVKDPPRRSRRIEYRRFGVRVVATSPDTYVWREPRQIEQPRLAFLQIYRRLLRQPDGSDADASFGLLVEKFDRPTKARAYAEALRGRALTLGARLSEEGGLVLLRKDCDGRPCRLEVSVRVEGDVGVQTVCVYHRAIEQEVKADCSEWLRSVEASRLPTPGGDGPIRWIAPARPERVPPGTEELHSAGFRAFSEGRWADAATAYAKAKALAPGYPGFAVNHAVALLALGKIEEALPELVGARPEVSELTPAIDRSIRDAYLLRGGRRLDDGDPAGALDDIREARRRDPAYAFAWSEEAATLAQMREWPACVAAATSALERQADRVEALATRAACLAHQEKVEEALADLDVALALAPLANAYVSRALLREQLGNRDGARADAAQVVRLDASLAPRVERLLKE